jgi:CRP-like cAMP-binding protein
MKDLWYLDNFDFYKILCPYKYEEHVQRHPNQCLKKHEFLFFEKDAAREIILIDRGKVKLGQYDQDGTEVVFAILGKGEILGQSALLGETRHRQFAEVLEDNTQVCKMSVEKAKELARDYVPFALEINRRIGGHIRRLERRIEILLFKDVRLRLVEFLKDLAEEHGRPKNGGIVVDHAMTQTDIAMMVGTSRKSASLMLNDLEDEGFIRFDRRQIFFPDVKKLDQAVERKM